MFGSGRDLLRFLSMLASGGTLDGKQLLTAESVCLLRLRLPAP
jgi:CubicO group peptidase (beta-lactamase class C family)